jgi:glutathione S-transferase
MLSLFAAAPASVPLIAVSPPSWAIQLALEVTGTAYDLHALDFAKGEHKAADFLALNPAGTVPALVHRTAMDDLVLSETGAALEYVDVLTPGELLPAEPQARGRALERFHRALSLKARGMAVLAAAMRDQPIPADATAALANTISNLEVTEALGLAEVLTFAYLTPLARLGQSMPADLETWLDRIRAHPAAQATWPATLDIPPERAPLRGP